jgi:hypothetical protein
MTKGLVTIQRKEKYVDLQHLKKPKVFHLIIKSH